MGLIDRLRSRWNAATAPQRPVLDLPAMDLPLRREAATQLASQRRQAEALSIGAGFGLDADDYQYRRITSDGMQHRDLTPLQQDRMLEIVWWLYESNPLAKRLITLMTDLVVGEGISVHAKDARLQDVISDVWNHTSNQLRQRLRVFHNSLSLNGELAIPVGLNAVTGHPSYGFIDPYQIKEVRPLKENILVPDVLVLKPSTATAQPKELQIIREDPVTGLLAGEVFYFAINGLPNSGRGRSDLMPLADWLDLYDQYLFSEAERVSLLSSFIWDLEVDGDEKDIKRALKEFPNPPKPGSVFGHNSKRKLTPVSPYLRGADRAETAKTLLTHIAGTHGFPTSYLGHTDSNRASIEGQNDVMMKTPASRQKEFGAMIDLMIRFAIEQARVANPSLFRNVDPDYSIEMPEISAKDVSRIGPVIASVAAAMDTALANKTVSRRLAVTATLAMLKQLGIDEDPTQVLEEIDEDAADAEEMKATMQALVAQRRTANPNPPIPQPPDDTQIDPADVSVVV